MAAPSLAAAAEAVRSIRVEYEPLPFVVDVETALAPDAPLVFDGPLEQPATGGGGATPGLPQRGNVRGPDTASRFGGARGDIARGLAEADVVVEGEFHTQVQTHSALETHGIVADWRLDGADGMAVHAGYVGRAAGAGRAVWSSPVAGPGDHRVHGRRVRCEVRHRQLRCGRRASVARDRAAGEAHARSSRGAHAGRQPPVQPANGPDRDQARRRADRDLRGVARNGGRRTRCRRRHHRARQGRSSTDAFGIGEPALIPTAAAIANAVYNATGARVRRLPMAPDVVLAALGTTPARRRES